MAFLSACWVDCMDNGVVGNRSVWDLDDGSICMDGVLIGKDRAQERRE